jgi:hypothetical protein
VGLWISASSGSSKAAPRGHLLLPASFLQNSLHITMEARGPAIDVFNFNDSCYQTCRQHPPGAPSTSLDSVVAAAGPTASNPRGPPSTSPTSVVTATGHAASTPQGARHRCFNSGGDRCRTSTSTPQEARHRRLQLQCWSLSDMP